MIDLSQRRPSPYSAGVVILSLVPGEEKIGLVFNIKSPEVKLVPKNRIRADNEHIVGEDGENYVVWFMQGSGFGIPFGKAEPEDDGSLVETTKRETLEETGSSIEGRLIEEVSYTERPDLYSAYSNTVFLANGVGFQFRRGNIKDDLTDRSRAGFKKFSELYELFRQPEQEETGNYLYQAALRRILAILLQMSRGMIWELGGNRATSPADLVRKIIAWDRRRRVGGIRYRYLFAHQMVKMACEIKREDVLLERLTDDRFKIKNPRLARTMARNIAVFSSDHMLFPMLLALLGRCDPVVIRGKQGLEKFIEMKIERREKRILRAVDQNNPEEHEPEERGCVGGYGKEPVEEDEAKPTEKPKKTAQPEELYGLPRDVVEQWLAADARR